MPTASTALTKQTETVSEPIMIQVTAADLTYLFAQLANLPNTPIALTLPTPYLGASIQINCNAIGGVNSGGTITGQFD
jgi:hypothetical protein